MANTSGLLDKLRNAPQVIKRTGRYLKAAAGPDKSGRPEGFSEYGKPRSYSEFNQREYIAEQRKKRRATEVAKNPAAKNYTDAEINDIAYADNQRQKRRKRSS